MQIPDPSDTPLAFHLRHEIPVPAHRELLALTIDLCFADPAEYLTATDANHLPPSPFWLSGGDLRRYTHEVRIPESIPLRTEHLEAAFVAGKLGEILAVEDFAEWCLQIGIHFQRFRRPGEGDFDGLRREAIGYIMRQLQWNFAMAQPLPLTDLEIVGYAERFLTEMLPAIAPPVFRHRSDTNRLFAPPFHEADSTIYGAAEITPEEFDHLVATGQATRLPSAIPAKPAHELWFDQQFRQHYGPFVAARDRLQKISEENIELARKALCAGDLSRAESLTAVAIRADDSRPEPFALRAAIRLSRGKKNAIAVMKLLAPPTVGDTAFTALVDFYRGCLPSSATAPRSAADDALPHPSGRRPMQGVAAEKPALAARAA